MRTLAFSGVCVLGLLVFCMVYLVMFRRERRYMADIRRIVDSMPDPVLLDYACSSREEFNDMTLENLVGIMSRDPYYRYMLDDVSLQVDACERAYGYLLNHDGKRRLLRCTVMKGRDLWDSACSDLHSIWLGWYWKDPRRLVAVTKYRVGRVPFSDAMAHIDVAPRDARHGLMTMDEFLEASRLMRRRRNDHPGTWALFTCPEGTEAAMAGKAFDDLLVGCSHRVWRDLLRYLRRKGWGSVRRGIPKGTVYVRVSECREDELDYAEDMMLGCYRDMYQRPYNDT